MSLVITNVTPTNITSGFHRGNEDFETFSGIIQRVLGGVISEQNVEVSAPNCRHVELIGKEDTLQIIFWGILEEDELGIKFVDLDTDTPLYGITRYYHYGFVPPYDNGIAIVSPEGVPVASWFPEYNILMTLFDACDTTFKDCEGTIFVFEEILKDFVSYYYGVGGEAIAERQRVARIELKKTSTVKLLNNVAKTNIATFKRTIDQSTKRLEEIKAEILNTLKTREHAMKQHDLYLMDSKENEEKILNEFNSILNIKHVVDYDVRGNNIIIETDNLVMPVKGKYFLAGRFKIEIDATTAKVRFFNLDEHNKRSAYWSDGLSNHPHVGNSGNACLGNATEGIAQCVHNAEWQALATILISFLQQANVDDPAGKKFYMWDECDKEGNVIRKSNGKDPFEVIMCHDCGKDIPATDSVHCHHTGYTVCNACSEWLPKYEAYVRKGLISDTAGSNKPYVRCKKCNTVTRRADQYRGTCNKCRAAENATAIKAKEDKAVDPWQYVKPESDNSQPMPSVHPTAIPMHAIDPWSPCDCPTCCPTCTSYDDSDEGDDDYDDSDEGDDDYDDSDEWDDDYDDSDEGDDE